MDDVKYEYALGCHVYEFNVFCKNQITPYQLSIEKDMAQERFNIVLLNLMARENEVCVKELKNIVCDCILDFFNKLPNSVLYFVL